jgi:hypothetical protein
MQRRNDCYITAHSSMCGVRSLAYFVRLPSSRALKKSFDAQLNKGSAMCVR